MNALIIGLSIGIATILYIVYSLIKFDDKKLHSS